MGGFLSMWDPEPWLQLQLLALRKNGLHIRYEFIRQTLKLITKPLNVLYFHEHFRDSFILFFCLGSPHLLNKPKTKDQTWLIYKQTNVNKLFIKLRTSYL